ncbi:MAG TPA: UdgX family uracil-DNA binding protein [Ilumatobacteraceae bacterium]|nr:UdgX family uracil-DNA binding protein [Ilumatobacteraceae bacterium]
MAAGSAEPFVPGTSSLRVLAEAAARCEGCSLYRDATQTVFGAGPASARLVLVGEQPGDVEDRRGRPFVGPAGAVLWACVDEAGVARDTLYATNAVKHFKHVVRGTRRIHKKPGTGEVTACHPWLEAEVRAVRPAVVVALGATAARAVLGRPVGIAASRHVVHEAMGASVVVTYHPSAVLRADERAAEVRAALVEDLARAADLAG